MLHGLNKILYEKPSAKCLVEVGFLRRKRGDEKVLVVERRCLAAVHRSGIRRDQKCTSISSPPGGERGEAARLGRRRACSVTQSCLTFCHPMDCSPPGSSVHGISQARILEWAAISSPRGCSRPRDQTQVVSSPALASGFLTDEPPWAALTAD